MLDSAQLAAKGASKSVAAHLSAKHAAKPAPKAQTDGPKGVAAPDKPSSGGAGKPKMRLVNGKLVRIDDGPGLF